MKYLPLVVAVVVGLAYPPAGLVMLLLVLL